MKANPRVTTSRDLCCVVPPSQSRGSADPLDAQSPSTLWLSGFLLTLEYCLDSVVLDLDLVGALEVGLGGSSLFVDAQRADMCYHKRQVLEIYES